jgi:hypothetical protein
MPSPPGSARFPFINLDKALGRAEVLFLGDRSGKPIPVGIAFDLWNYSPKSSGGFQTISALKAYGLADDDGSNEDRKIKLSQAAKHYFLDERDEERNAFLSNFALNPPIFRELWEIEGWKDGMPADTVARSRLKIDRQLNDQSARALLSIFKDNIQFAGLNAGPASLPISKDDDEEEIIEQKQSRQHFVPSDMVRSTIRATPEPTPTKPIVFDMETVSGRYSFDNADDLADFIGKLEKIKALLPPKTGIFD